MCREQYLTGPIHHLMGLHWLKRQIQSSACSPHTSMCRITAEQCDIYVIKSTLTLRTDVLHWEKLRPGRMSSRTACCAASTLPARLGALFVNGSPACGSHRTLLWPAHKSNASRSPAAAISAHLFIYNHTVPSYSLARRASSQFIFFSSFHRSFMKKRHFFLKEHNMAGPFLQHLIENIFKANSARVSVCLLKGFYLTARDFAPQ